MEFAACPIPISAGVGDLDLGLCSCWEVDVMMDGGALEVGDRLVSKLTCLVLLSRFSEMLGGRESLR